MGGEASRGTPGRRNGLSLHVRIVLDVVDAPRGPQKRVLRLVVARGGKARAGVGAFGCVETAQEPQRVDVVSDSLDCGRQKEGNEVSKAARGRGRNTAAARAPTHNHQGTCPDWQSCPPTPCAWPASSSCARGRRRRRGSVAGRRGGRQQPQERSDTDSSVFTCRRGVEGEGGSSTAGAQVFAQRARYECAGGAGGARADSRR